MIQKTLTNHKEFNLVKSPFNYTGGKYRLLKQLLPLFPSDINTMVDVFGGGFNVGANILSQNTIYNDHITPLSCLLEYLYNNSIDNVLDYIYNRISDYGLSKNNKDSFNLFRKDYNNSDYKHPLDLFVLNCYSFNHQLRWNNKREYNSSHGTNRSSFNSNTEKNLINFMNRLHDLHITFFNKDFMDLNYNKFSSHDFLYFDPPYLVSTAMYNDGKRGFKNWTVNEETQLYTLLSDLDSNNIYWGLSNTITNNGETNQLFKEWLEDNNKFKIYRINSDYSNSNYHKKNKTKKDNYEVYVTNI